jgi:hypothetical protein
VGWSTMDPRPRGDAELTGAWPAATPVDRNSSRGCWEVVVVAENLIGSEVWRWGNRVGRAMRPNYGGGRSSSAQGLERGGEEMGGGWLRWSMARSRVPFIGPEDGRGGGVVGGMADDGVRD